MVEFAHWLQATPFSVAMQSRTWLIALLQAIHILMIGVVFVSLLMISLRVLGRVRPEEAFATVWAAFAPWMWTGLAAMALTGLLLIIGEPVRQATATSFWLKMGLLVVAVACVLWLRLALTKNQAGPDSPRHAMVAGGVIAILVVIVFLGRAIAYDVEVWGCMDLKSFADAAQSTGVAEWMRSSLKAMPIIEATHVLAVAMVFGSILIVDLRHAGLPAYAATLDADSSCIRITWAAFAVAVITGALMFAPNAITYVGNTAFQLKMLALAAVGVNMLVFQSVSARSVEAWDQNASAPAVGQAGWRAVDPAVDHGDHAWPLDRIHQGLRLHGS